MATRYEVLRSPVRNKKSSIITWAIKVSRWIEIWNCVGVKSNQKTVYPTKVIDTSCHPVLISIIRCDQLGIPDIRRIVTALVGTG